ncbi:MFS transporter [Paraburkholderia rhizosphaerae]|uniref:Putative MFS family arabinose efflux permease n=1 Tax=Paraburkholderia rhizosphaerae TaxID=480658 RepID=A0A4R8LX99_9BURK|nr:MFS transporter [Paraburkholderia rhizosphaerae]TDY51437.1 putative MFS family arabinose efflux permease [Paraburkholderia rhizosphaerae]
MAQTLKTSALDRRVWLVAIAFFAIGTDFNVVSGILPALARSLDVSVPAAGQVVTSYAFFYAICAPLLAGLTTSMRRKPLIAGSLTAFALANAASALAPTFAFLIGTRIVAAFAASMFAPAAYGFAASLATPERKGAALSAALSGITASLVVGVPIGSYIGNRFGWQGSFWFVTALALVGAIGLGFRLEHHEEQTAAPAMGAPAASFLARFAPLAKRPVLLGMVPSLVWYVAMFSLYTYLGATFTERGMTKEGLSAMFAAFGIGSLIGNHVGGSLGDRFGSQRVIATALVIQIANLAWLGTTGASLVANALAVAIFGMNVWFMFPAQQSRLLALAPKHGPLVLALNNSTMYLGGAIGSAVSALLIRHGVATANLPWVSCVLYIAALVVFALCSRALRCDARVSTRTESM